MIRPRPRRRPAAAVAPEDAPLAAWLAGRRVLVAYGLLGDTTAALRRVGIDYMWAQQDWLRAVGAAPEVVRAPTAASVAANAARIRAALLASERPALIIAHSKGGLEALAALLDPAAAARCAGFVAFQSPFFGSPVADAVAGSRPLHGLARLGFRALRIGDGEGLRDLTTPVRAAWMRAHANAVADLLRRVPVVTAATRLDAAALGGIGRDRAYGIVTRWLERQAGPNDGLVAVSSALLPGARQSVDPGGHVALVAAGGGRDPVGALRRAVRMVAAPGG
ncbi:hypothetical protein GCM10009416_20640 [Craurococcus roseus]|uniref:Alpha/beta hydrolase n=1 Tax=Craurococcus roseus TaxID=77585 RepID=A0ABN1F4G4_9PROT